MRIDTIEYFLKCIKTEMMTEQPSHCNAVDLKILRLRYLKIFSNKTIKNIAQSGTTINNHQMIIQEK